MAIGLKQAAFNAMISRNLWKALVTGVISALIIPFLLIVLGLAVELLVRRGEVSRNPAGQQQFVTCARTTTLIPTRHRE